MENNFRAVMWDVPLEDDALLLAYFPAKELPDGTLQYKDGTTSKRVDHPPSHIKTIRQDLYNFMPERGLCSQSFIDLTITTMNGVTMVKQEAPVVKHEHAPAPAPATPAAGVQAVTKQTVDAFMQTPDTFKQQQIDTLDASLEAISAACTAVQAARNSL